MRKLFYILLLWFICGSCIDRFPLDNSSYENLVVVDALLDNSEGPYTVRLSRSSSVSRPSYIPIEDALVKIIEEGGPTEILEEIEPGTYRTNPDGIKGKSGRRYKLSFLINGNMYESPFIKLMNSIPIDSVYYNIEQVPTANPEIDLEGYQFYINTSEPSTDSAYYLWWLNETWKYHAAFTIDYTYSGYQSPGIQPFQNSDSLYTCWKSEEVGGFWLESTADLESPVLKDFPLNFVSTQTNRLSIRYSLLVKQYSVTSEAFKYWQAVREQLTNDDILFNSQVYQVRGNLVNVNDLSEPVMGYFTVGGVSSRRIFADRPEGIDVMEYSCPFVVPSFDIAFSGPEDWPIFLAQNPGGGAGYVEQYCFDCRTQGGKLEKPEYWRDE